MEFLKIEGEDFVTFSGLLNIIGKEFVGFAMMLLRFFGYTTTSHSSRNPQSLFLMFLWKKKVILTKNLSHFLRF